MLISSEIKSKSQLSSTQCVKGNLVDDDRITKLPSHIKGCILQHMSVLDAAKTSILCKEWRYLWSENPSLVFDHTFRDKQCNDGHKFFARIDNILSSHVGSVDKIVICIPAFFRQDGYSYVNHFMNCTLMISKSDVQKLSIEHGDKHSTFSLPNFTLDCPKLTHLNLSSCYLEPLTSKSPAVRCLNRLVFLCLDNVDISDDVMKRILRTNFETIRDLSFVNCTGIGNLSMQLPNIRSFRLVGGDGINWRFFETNHFPECASVKLAICQYFLQGRAVDYVKVLGNLYRTKDLRLNSSFLKALAAGGIPKSLPNSNNQLTKICLRMLSFFEMAQVSPALCILQNSPNLKFLEINVARIFSNYITGPDSTIHVFEAKIIQILENPECIDKGAFQMLETVKWEGLNGIKTEILFIKLLLSRSPKLRSFRIKPKWKPAEETKLWQDLVEYPKASAKANIIYDVKDRQLCGYSSYVDPDLSIERFSL